MPKSTKKMHKTWRETQRPCYSNPESSQGNLHNTWIRWERSDNSLQQSVLDQKPRTSNKILSSPNEASRFEPKSTQSSLSLSHTGIQKRYISPAKIWELTTKGAFGWGTSPQLLVHRFGGWRPRLQRSIFYDRILREANKDWGVDSRWLVTRKEKDLTPARAQGWQRGDDLKSAKCLLPSEQPMQSRELWTSERQRNIPW